MKVCMISGSFPNMKCGVGDYTANLSRELAKDGICIDVITSHNLETTTKIENGSERLAITLHPIMKNWGLENTLPLLERIRQLNPDIIHVQYQRGTYYSRELILIFPVLARFVFPDVPIIVTFHDLQAPYILQRLLKSVSEHILFPWLILADGIIVSNHGDSKRIRKMVPWVKTKIRQIPVGANVGVSAGGKKDKAAIRARLGMVNGAILISTFCNVVFMNYIMLFKAMHSLIKDGYDLRLVVIGGIPAKSSKNDQLDKDYRQRIGVLAKKLEISEFLSYTGYLPPSEVSAYLSASDLCVQLYWKGVSNRNATFSTVLAHGLPTITTLGDEKPEGLIDYRNVIFVPCDNVKALTIALGELIDSPALRSEIGRTALTLFQERYDWNKIARSIEELYNSSFYRYKKKKG